MNFFMKLVLFFSSSLSGFSLCSNNACASVNIPAGTIVTYVIAENAYFDESSKSEIKLTPVKERSFSAAWNDTLYNYTILGEGVLDSDIRTIYVKCNKMINNKENKEIAIDAYVAGMDGKEGLVGNYWEERDLFLLPEKGVVEVIFLKDLSL